MKIRQRNKVLISFFLIMTMSLMSCRLIGSVDDQVDQVIKLIPMTAPNLTATPTPQEESIERSELDQIQEGFSRVYEQVLPSVVNIRVTQILDAGIAPETGPLPYPFDLPDDGRELRRSGLGSGFIWDREGHIVTNHHVIKNADQVVVTFYDGTSVDAEIMGADHDSDLAVLKVEHPDELPAPIQLTDSTRVKVGQLVAAIGNPFGLDGTMTIGVVSALGRWLPVEANDLQGSPYTIPDVIQTDAPINPGNSGGVLVDMHGQLIGVPTAIESSSGVNAGIGFVVPSIIVGKVVPALIEQGHYEHPWIGISGATLNSEMAKAMGLAVNQRGVLVVDVIPNSPAESAGLLGSDHLKTINGQEMRLGGDVIIEIDSQPTRDFEDLTAYLARYTEAGQTVTLTVLRDNRQESLELTLGVRPITEPGVPSEKNEGSGEAWLGIYGATLTPEIAAAMHLQPNQKGVLIQQVLEGSPADQAGLRGSYKSITIDGERVLFGGDIIIALGDRPIVNMADLQRALGEYQPGDELILEILRDGDRVKVKVTLGKAP
jgi:serine protease Do